MRMSLALVVSAFQWKKRPMRRGRKRAREGNIVILWDLMIEILTRLPAKSLMRFKCVSKLWLSFIRSRYFSNLYLTVPRPPRLYVSLVEHPYCDSLELCHNPGKSVMLSLSPTSATCFDPDLAMSGKGGHHMVVLRGLVLYVVCRKACIYNPATRQSLILPSVPSHIFAAQQGLDNKKVSYFLGHDPLLDQYKVVCNVLVLSGEDIDSITSESEHWVFLLESGSCWRKLEFGQVPQVTTRLGMCISGVVYYLATPPYTDCDTVVSFDVRSEVFSVIQAPPEVSGNFGELVGFIEYDEKPTVIDHTHLAPQGVLHLWFLEHGGKWFKKSLALQPCQMHLLTKDTDFVVEGSTKNGEIIFAPRGKVSAAYFLFYNLQKNDLRKVDIRGIRDHYSCKSYLYYTLMDKSESIMHLET